MRKFISLILCCGAITANAACGKIYTANDITIKPFTNTSGIDYTAEYIKFLGSEELYKVKNFIAEPLVVTCNGHTITNAYMSYSCIKQQGMDNGYAFTTLYIRHDMITNGEPNTFSISDLNNIYNKYDPLYGASSNGYFYFTNCASVVVDGFKKRIYTLDAQ